MLEKEQRTTAIWQRRWRINLNCRCEQTLEKRQRFWFPLGRVYSKTRKWGTGNLAGRNWTLIERVDGVLSSYCSKKLWQSPKTPLEPVGKQ